MAAGQADKLQAEQERDGVRMGIEIARSRHEKAQPQQPQEKPTK
jgi:hypothetical protein